jgi:hypothetical protein
MTTAAAHRRITFQPGARERSPGARVVFSAKSMLDLALGPSVKPERFKLEVAASSPAPQVTALQIIATVGRLLPSLGSPAESDLGNGVLGLAWRAPGVWLSADIDKDGQASLFARNDNLRRADLAGWVQRAGLPEDIAWVLEGVG